MDRNRFDDLARKAASTHSRRAALATLLGAALLGSDTAARNKKKKRRRLKAQNGDIPARCYRGRRCDPGPGSNNSGCDFSYSDIFRNKNVGGSNLGNTNFTGADLTGTDFRGSNLSGACFVGAVLAGATLGSSVNLRNATFCGTIMPDGTENNRDCNRSKRCCPTDVTALRCRNQGQSCNPFTVSCCSGLFCAPWFHCVADDTDVTCIPQGDLCAVSTGYPDCCGGAPCNLFPPICL